MLKWLPIVCLLFAFNIAKADTFTVTSNADSGPGTLRDALTKAAANGNAVKDFVYFNLPGSSITDRTINLITQLPAISSNLVIDGTTQPGAKFGDSDAKVRISTPTTNDQFTTFRIQNVKDIELYGLYILDYTYINTNWPDVGLRTGLQIENSENITLGAQGKGNLIKGFHNFSIIGKKVNGFKLQANIFGLNENNNMEHPPYGSMSQTAGLSLEECNDLLIGGDALAEGNTFLCGLDIAYNDKAITHTINIKSNNFGVFKDGVTTTPFFQDEFVVQIYTMGINSPASSPSELDKAVTVNLNIKNNTAGNFGRAFYLNGFKGNVSFTGNYLGVARDGVTSTNHGRSHPNEGGGFNVENSLANVTVGGANTADKNYFFDHITGVNGINSPNILIRNNEYRCMVYGAYGSSTPLDLPQIKLAKRATAGGQTIITGTATPNALIDIYGSTACDYASCSIGGKITTVTANASGNWNASINASGTIYAAATFNGKTSLFKTFEINTDNITVINVRCGFSGSITGATVPEGLSPYWVNEQGIVVSHDLNLINAAPGRYKLVLNDCISTDFYEIKDNKVYLYEYSKTITNAGCGMATGSIKGIFYNDPLGLVNSITWKNAAGVVVSNQIEATNLPAGSYSLRLTTSDGCEKNYGPVDIVNTDGPAINLSGKVVTPTNCSVATGSIKGITVTGTNLTYSWKNDQQVEVSTALNLIDQPSGMYTLTVTDGSSCVSSTQPIFLFSIGDLSIRQENLVIQGATCNSNNGVISGLTVAGGGPLTIAWTNSQGQFVSNDLRLSDVPAGKYTLTLSSGICTPVSADFDIPETNGIIIDETQKVVTQPTCQNGNGSITNIQVTGATKYTWYNFYDNNKVVSHNIDLVNKPPGTYYLVAENNNGCSKKSANYTIDRPTSTGYSGISKSLKDATCDQNNGSIEVIFLQVTGLLPTSYKWVNSATGQIFTTTIPKLTGIDAGTYDVYGTENGCEKYIITYSIGRVPKTSVNTTNVQVNDYSCNLGGSITGMQLSLPTGQYKAQWLNENDQPVCDCVDLLNANPGKYRFKVTNLDGSCIQLFGPYEIKAINAVSLVTTNVNVRSQTACELGQITGLTSPDATSFAWRRKNSTDIISPAIDLLGVPAGDYELTISNANCSRVIPFNIQYVPPVQFQPFPVTVTKSCHAFGTGTITVNTNNAPSQPTEYRWMNSDNVRVGYDKTVQYLPAGTYRLFVRDNTGCESANPVQQVTVGEVPEMVTVFGNSHDIYCGIGNGSIDAPTVTGGRGSYIYTWTDANGTIIAPLNQKSLSNLSAGSYTLAITDFDPQQVAVPTCNLAQITYTIKESDLSVPPPIVNDKEVNRKGNTTLAVQDAYATAIYRLYDSETSTTPLDEAQGGNFTINVTETKTYWVELTYGSCPSVRSKATIVLGLIADAIPNAFSPNGDGVNDYWVIKGIEESTMSNVKVFNRQGQAVFQSRGYAKPFDGTYMGKQLPAGVYYYIIERQNDKPLSGHVTIIR
ncbi:gliding motility-associated C-terminal domain-containing protein [Mucilaginibacter conchicola]|uniref:Gliding motility-associated C-terminal domain-containing protein n=1 Tax=Mucilaginibacter conchicola TaxID=2303333 RepID=A0A372NRL3_9SPHI|nr:gliding motility-associated C-terminal domain-containing protein [Mucilaginibacter conchicola]RFZ91772.1 gliding motility-associated C-terminal domain-containing protein [Mucilaginibacter conchicola]